MTAELTASFAHCQRIARQAAGNFYYSFLILPRAKRRAMCALYAFLRHTDDLGDSDEPANVRGSRLADWRRSLDRAFAGATESAILPALVDTVAEFQIPREYLYEAISGVEMDLVERTFETFADLEVYCYKVASVVGLACIHIWRFSDPAAIEPASRLGVAFQLTNILRDLKEDAQRRRVYLPEEDLRRFGCMRSDVLECVRDRRMTDLVNFEVARADQLYREGAVVESYLEPDSQGAFRAMLGIYHGLLEEIKHRDGDVFSTRVRLSTWRKMTIAIGSCVARPPWSFARRRSTAPRGEQHS